MKPTDPIGTRKLRLLHMHYRRLTPDAVQGVYDEIERVTGRRTSSALNEAQGWAVLDGLCRAAGERNPEPICVEWCPVYTRQGVQAEETSTARFPSQRQVWALYCMLREAGVQDMGAFLKARFPKHAPAGVLRTAQDAWWVTKSLRAMASRPSRAPGPPRRHKRRAHG